MPHLVHKDDSKFYVPYFVKCSINALNFPLHIWDKGIISNLEVCLC